MEEGTDFYEKFDKVFSGIVHVLSNSSPSIILRDYFFDLFTSLIYANIISNFFTNLTEEIASNLKLDVKEISEIKKKFGHIEEETKGFISEPVNNVKIDKLYYEQFKQDLGLHYPTFLLILSEIEKQVKINNIDDYLQKKNKGLEGIGDSKDDYNKLLQTKALELYIQNNNPIGLKDLNLDTIVRNPDLFRDSIRQINEPYYRTEKRRLLVHIQKNQIHQVEFKERLYERWQKPLELYEMMIEFAIDLGQRSGC